MTGGEGSCWPHAAATPREANSSKSSQVVWFGLVYFSKISLIRKVLVRAPHQPSAPRLIQHYWALVYDWELNTADKGPGHPNHSAVCL